MPITPFVPIPNVARIALRATLGDDLDVLNIFHVEGTTSGPFTPTAMGDVATQFFTIWVSHFKTALSNQLVFQDCTAKDLTDDTGAVFTHIPSAPVAGENSDADVLPANCALAISWKEVISYRGGHPRTYLAGLNRSNMADPQHVSTAFASGIQGLAIATLAALADATVPGFGNLVLVAAHLRGVGSDRHLLSVQHLTGATTNTRLDSQRRRLRR